MPCVSDLGEAHVVKVGGAGRASTVFAQHGGDVVGYGPGPHRRGDPENLSQMNRRQLTVPLRGPGGGVVDRDARTCRRQDAVLVRDQGPPAEAALWGGPVGHQDDGAAGVRAPDRSGVMKGRQQVVRRDRQGSAHLVEAALEVGDVVLPDSLQQRLLQERPRGEAHEGVAGVEGREGAQQEAIVQAVQQMGDTEPAPQQGAVQQPLGVGPWDS